jgi:hypothetical protein
VGPVRGLGEDQKKGNTQEIPTTPNEIQISRVNYVVVLPRFLLKPLPPSTLERIYVHS